MGFTDIVLNFVSKYDENPALKFIVTTSFDGIGPLLDVAFSTISQLATNRLEKGIEKLGNEFKDLNPESISKEFLQDESFYDLIRSYFEKSIKTRNDEKLQYLARLVSHGIKNPQTLEQTEQNMERIFSLSLRDIWLMNKMYGDNLRNPELFANPKDVIEGSLMTTKVPNNLPDVDRLNTSEVEVSVNNLIATGLVREYAGAAGDYKGGWYFITPLLKEIMETLYRKKLLKT